MTPNRLAFAISLIALALPLYSAPLVTLANQADIIVVGTTTSRLEGPDAVSFDIIVQRVIEGTVGVPSLHVSHSWNGAIVGGQQNLTFTATGVWALTKGTSGDWDVMPCRPGKLFDSLYYPATQNAPTGLFAYNTDASVLDALVYEVGSGFESIGANPEFLLGAIDGLNGNSVTKVFEAYVRLANPAFRAIGLAGLVGSGAPGILANIGELRSSLGSEPRASYGRGGT